MIKGPKYNQQSNQKESQATISESSHIQWSFIQQKAHLCYDHEA